MTSYRWRLFPLLLAFLVTTSHAAPSSPPAQPRPDSTTLGVVWTPPSSQTDALHQLDQIAQIGAMAVRLTRPPTAPIAARADSLGLELFVDLPIDYVSGPQLQDAWAQIAPALKHLRSLAQDHSAITHVGLGPTVDTTVPAACETLRRWTEHVYSWDAPLRTYYLTPFRASTSHCAEAVDRVLLDLRGHPTPVKRWRRWHAQADPVDIGALGQWVDPNAKSGLRVPHSPEHQARYLERTLGRLLDSTETAPEAVFVARWQDQSSPALPSRRYGLHAENGPPRPAARVVQGIYTGRQRVFAFPAGPPDNPGPYRLVLLGWGLLLLLGSLYARSPFLRETVARYFVAPGFYRDSLRDGRDLSPGAHGLLLAIVAGILGTTGACAARLAATAPATEHVLTALPQGLRFLLAGGLEHPLTAGLLIGGIVLGLLLVWILSLVLTARGWTRFSVSQGLALVVWPCWPALLVLPLALTAGPDAPIRPALFGLLLLGGSPLLLVYVTSRVLFDYWTVTDLPAWTLFPLTLLSPLALTTAIGLVYSLRHDLSLRFL